MPDHKKTKKKKVDAPGNSGESTDVQYTAERFNASTIIITEAVLTAGKRHTKVQGNLKRKEILQDTGDNVKLIEVMNEFLLYIPDLKALKLKIKKSSGISSIETLQGIQNVHKLRPQFDQIAPLIKSNVDSATMITKMGKQSFLTIAQNLGIGIQHANYIITQAKKLSRMANEQEKIAE